MRQITAVLLSSLLGCAAPEVRLSSPQGPALELVESWPSGTTLNNSDLRDAKDVWPEMIGRARRTLDIAEFYVSDAPGSRLSPVLAAVEEAARRGVRVRVLAEETFYALYPKSLDRLANVPGISVRRYDVKSLMGGILHAKYFVVDGEEAYLGSQNFDWRSLEHIQEIGVRISSRAEVASLSDVFETDWALAGGGDRAARVHRAGPSAIVASPKGWLPDEREWDLPRLVEMVDGARRTVRVQLLTYGAKSKGGEVLELDSALRRAAARGVRVELMVADWSKRPDLIDGLKALTPAVSVKLVTIPQADSGFIDHARVVHAKYLVVDGERAWIGTSNWERGYFYAMRNVGVLVGPGAIPPRLDRFFADLWNSSYAEALDPTKSYVPPKISE